MTKDGSSKRLGTNSNPSRGTGSVVNVLHGFVPRIVDSKYLSDLEVDAIPSQETLQKLQNGSSVFLSRYRNSRLIAEPNFLLKSISPTKPLKDHRYTSRCPVDVLDVDPMLGCNSNCLYCLVNNGDHSATKFVYENYASYLKTMLENGNGMDHYYYFSARTEPFQEPTLKTGISHDILRVFITHFKKKPKSKSKVFILSKAGKEELQYRNNGDSILDLMSELSDNLLYHTSVSMVPPDLVPVLEPRAASNENRLEAAVMCQGRKILADWAVVQPIFPMSITDGAIDGLLSKLKKANIKGFKPELLTLSIESLAWIGQLIGHMNKGQERKLYELYISNNNKNNVKHNDRVAPNREYARETMTRLQEKADRHGLKMSVCHWVRSEISLSTAEVPLHMRESLSGIGPGKVGVCKPVGPGRAMA